MERAAAIGGAPMEHRYGIANGVGRDMLREVFSDWRIGGAFVCWSVICGTLQEMIGTQSLLRRFLGTSSLVALLETLSLLEYLNLSSGHELLDTWNCLAWLHLTAQVMS